MIAGVSGIILAGYGLIRRGGAPPAPESQNPVHVVWAFEAVERGAIVSSPYVAQDRVYVGAIQDQGLASTGAVYCLDRATGKAIWEFDNDGTMQHMYSSPCVAEGRLYIGEGMHANQVCNLYCLDPGTGKKLWNFETAGHIESSPCVVENKVLFGSGDDGLYCLETKTGALLWHFAGPFHMDSNPASAGAYVFAGSGVSRKHTSSAIFCLDLRDGAVVWRCPTDLPAWGSPVVEGNQVLCGLGNGRLMQSARPPDKPAGALFCLDRQTGEPQWHYDVADGVLAKPALDAERAYFGCRDGYCYAIDRKNGRLCWKANVGGAVVTSPCLCDGYLYVVPSAGRVCRLDAATGDVNWSFDVGEYSQTKPRLVSSPTVIREADGHHLIFFGAELRNPAASAAVVYCLRD